MKSPAQQRQGSDDEIDLFELALLIWQEKVTVLLVTVFVTVLAVFYALFATPVYETEVTLLPPHASDIQGYNQGLIALKDTDSSWLTKHTTKSVYDTFLKRLYSKELRNQIMEELYLPRLPEKVEILNRQALQQRFEKIVSVRRPDPKNTPDLYTVQVRLSDPEHAAELANGYVELAIQQAKQRLKADVEAEYTRVQLDLEAQLASLLQQAEQERKSELTKLTEALWIAESLGLEQPILPDGKSTIEGAAYVDRNLLYMRGAKALQAQIRVLEERDSEIPFIDEYPELAAKLALLRAFKLDDRQVNVATIDEVAEVPIKPVQPKKMLIVAISGLVGGALGVGAALIVALIKRRRRA